MITSLRPYRPYRKQCTKNQRNKWISSSERRTLNAGLPTQFRTFALVTCPHVSEAAGAPDLVRSRSPVVRRASILNVLTEDHRGGPRRHGAETRAVTALKVDVLDVKGVDVAGEEPVRLFGSAIKVAQGWGCWRMKRTDPSSVRMMLMKRSVPQPAIMKTPAGGTVKTPTVSDVRVGDERGHV